MASPPVDFFFDTSALVKYYHPEKGTRAVRFWINDFSGRRHQPARFFFPNLCIPEILHVFYVLRYLKGKLTGDLLNRLRATFLNDLERRKLAVCNLTRRDILATEPLYELAHEEYRSRPRQEEGLLSPMDIMILAMAHNFKASHSNLFLVTADTQMVRVAARIGLQVLNPNDYQAIPEELKP